jgi:YD repeat-containing protein
MSGLITSLLVQLTHPADKRGWLAGARPAGARMHGARMYGAAMAEFVVTLPVLVLLGLGVLQTGLMYNAKNILTYATFEAARKGAVSHAATGPMQGELGLRIAPLFGGDGSPEKALAAIARGTLEAMDPRYTRIEVLNPTAEAFTDFGVENAAGVTEIPNDALRYRSAEPGASSGVSIQDANLLKIRVTYAYRLTVPLLNRVIPAVMTRLDPANARYYQLGRIPVSAVATLRMQSPARKADHSGGGPEGGSGTVPGGDSGAGTDPDAADQGGAPGFSEGRAGNPFGDPSGNPSSPADPSAPGGCDASTGSCTGQPPDVVSCAADPDHCRDTGAGGARNCQTDDSDAATNQTLAVQDTQTGNPVNVVTGNKFQHEVDIAPLSAEPGLSFSRYYNSIAAGQANGLGQGWRHNYQLRVRQHASGELSIIQADGRRVVFTVTGDASRYTARVAGDGWLEQTRQPHAFRIWHRPEGPRLVFDHQGLLVRADSPAGQYLRLTYTPENDLRQVTDSQGRQLTFEYYPNRRLQQVYDPAGKRLRYRYDQQGRLASVVNREDQVRWYHYEDPRFPNHLTGITDERGVRYATWAYDEQGRGIVSEHAGGAGRVTLAYGTGETRVTNSEGITSVYRTEVRQGIPLVTAIRGPGCSRCNQGDVVYTYNERLQLTRARRQNGVTRYYHYDPETRLSHAWQEDESGHRQHERRYYYEDAGRSGPTRIERPSVNPEGSRTTQIRYNEAGQPLTITDRGYRPGMHGGFEVIQRETRLRYDDHYRLTEIDGPRDDVADSTYLSYDSGGRLQRITDPGGAELRILDYDAYGRPVRVASQGLISTVTYNTRGQITQLDRQGRIFRWLYDARGMLLQFQDARGQVRRYTYDAAGRVIAEADQTGQRIATVWDNENRVTSRTFASRDGGISSTLHLLYDIRGRLKQISDNGQQTVLDYAHQGRTVELRGAGSPFPVSVQ